MKILIFAAIIGIIAANRNESMSSNLKPEVLQRPAPYQILRKAKMMEEFELIDSSTVVASRAFGGNHGFRIVHGLSSLMVVLNKGEPSLRMLLYYLLTYTITINVMGGGGYVTDKHNPIIVFDSAGRYNTNGTVKVRAISLSNVHSCNEVAKSYNDPRSNIVQVLHIPTTTSISVIHCEIYYTVFTQYCDSNVFLSALYPREIYKKNKVIVLTNKECREFHNQKSIAVFLFKEQVLLDKATKNKKFIEKTLHGRSYSKKIGDGGCEGVSFSLGNEVRENTVLSVHISYSVRTRKGLYDSLSNMIRVEPDLIEFPLDSSGISCDQDMACFGYSLEGIPRSRCQRTQQAFVGNGTFFKPKNVGKANNLAREIIQIVSNDVTQSVTLVIESLDRLCGHQVMKTSVPGVYVNKILEDHDLIVHNLMHNGTYEMDKIEGIHLDLLTSMNTATIKTALQNTEKFDEISKEICEQRRHTLINSIRDNLISESAQLLNLKRGLVFKRIGGISYLYAGPAILAYVRVTERCYTDIPVEFKVNKKLIKIFATSNGRILIENSTEVSCDQEIPIHFLPYLDEELDLQTETENSILSLVDNNPPSVTGRWLCQTEGRFYQCPPPEILNPSAPKALRFNGITGDLLMGSFFGSVGREKLFRIQTSAIRSRIVNEKLGDLLDTSTLGIALISTITREGEAMLREKLYPTLYWLLGDSLHKFEHFVLIAIGISMIINLVSLVFRMKNLLLRYGCTAKLLVGLVEQLYIAILPLANKNNDFEEQITILGGRIGAIEDQIGEFRYLNLMNRLRDLDIGLEGDHREIVNLGMRVTVIEDNLGEFTFTRYKELRFKLDALIIGQLDPPRIMPERIFGLGGNDEDQDFEDFQPGNNQSGDAGRRGK